jgi:hypothetical protein
MLTLACIKKATLLGADIESSSGIAGAVNSC